MKWLIYACLLIPAVTAACPEAAPRTDRPADFVPLAEIAPTIEQELRYAGADNFLGRSVTGYEQAQCWLTRPAAKALAAAHAELASEGLGLKVLDCYRPQRAVDDFMRWAAGPTSPTAATYYPDIPQTQLIPQGYIAACSGHTRGSTVDLTIVRLGQPLEGVSPDLRGCSGTAAGQLDMGSGYDCFGPSSHTLTENVTGEARSNRLKLKTLMEKHGFVNYAKEWWHYSLKNEPYPGTWFDFPIGRIPSE